MQRNPRGIHFMVRQELGQIMQPDKLVNVALLLTHFRQITGLLCGDNAVVRSDLLSFQMRETCCTSSREMIADKAGSLCCIEAITCPISPRIDVGR